MKLSEAIGKYVRYLEKQQFSESHLNTVKSRLGHFEKRHPDYQVEAITREELRQYFKKLGVGRAEATMAGYAATHRAFWKFAKKKKWIGKNISKKMKGYSYDPVHRRAAPERSVRAVASSVGKFVNHRNNNPRDLRDGLLVSLAIDSGARLGEMRSLQKHAVRRALAQPTLAENGQAVFHIIGNGKTGGSHLRFFNGTMAERWAASVIELDFLQNERRRVNERCCVEPFVCSCMQIRQCADVSLSCTA